MTQPTTSTITSVELSRLLSGELRGADVPVTGLESLELAREGHLTFIRAGKFARAWATSRASAALVTRGIELPAFDEKTRCVIFVADADRAMTQMLERFMPAPHEPAVGVHPSAVIDPSAQIAGDARIGPHVSIGPRSVIGAGAVLHAGARIGGDARIGAKTIINSGVAVLDRCIIGERCIVHANVVIGADGFGYRVDPATRSLVKVPHIGHVEIGNDVEIGACSTIDRGKFGATVVGLGTKIDNHVQIAHNVRIGRSSVICGCVGIAGSVTIGSGVMIGGLAGVADGITIGDGVQVGAGAGVMSDIAPGETVVGNPAVPRREWARTQISLRRLGEQSQRPQG